MPLPPSRQDLIAGIIDDVRSSRVALGADAPAARPGAALEAATRRALAAANENPFASFYESRRKVSAEGVSDTADISSSITRAYIVPESLLVLARGGEEREQERADDDGVTAVRSIATKSGKAPTESTGSFGMNRSMGIVRTAEGTAGAAAQSFALQAVAWLRRLWRHSVSD